jgi:hypothetical protein
MLLANIVNTMDVKASLHTPQRLTWETANAPTTPVVSYLGATPHAALPSSVERNEQRIAARPYYYISDVILAILIGSLLVDLFLVESPPLSSILHHQFIVESILVISDSYIIGRATAAFASPS